MLHSLCSIEVKSKADDPKKDQSRRSRSKGDDLWVQGDDSSKGRLSFVKVDDLSGSKQTIFESKQMIWGESGRSYLNFLKRESGQS